MDAKDPRDGTWPAHGRTEMRPSPSVLLVKRLIDIAVGLCGTAAFVFFYPILALLIKLESPGPVLYSQERIGINTRMRRRSEDAMGGSRAVAGEIAGEKPGGDETNAPVRQGWCKP